MSDDLTGRRVRLIAMNDPYGLDPGIEDAVVHVDSLGTLHVRWDDRSSLGLVPSEDEWETLPSLKTWISIFP